MSEAVGVATAASIAAAYAGARARISALAAGLDEQQAGARVPACPAWAVKDVVAHLAGICADILAGNIDGVATDPWTAAQVTARRDNPLEQTLAEWSELGPQVEALVPAFPLDAARQMIADLVTHEHDVRGALRRPGARDSDAVAIAIHFVAPNFLAAGARAGLPPLRIRADDTEWATEGVEPETSMTAERFEVLRALTGRRSERQIRQLQWSGDPAPHLAAFTWGPFAVSSVDIVE